MSWGDLIRDIRTEPSLIAAIKAAPIADSYDAGKWRPIIRLSLCGMPGLWRCAICGRLRPGIELLEVWCDWGDPEDVAHPPVVCRDRNACRWDAGANVAGDPSREDILE